MKRSLLIALAVLVACAVSFTASAGAQPTSKQGSRGFQGFQHRVCRGEKAMGRKAAPALTRFNDAYYNEEEHTPENLKAAGRELRRLYSIYSAFNKHILTIHSPAASSRTWGRYGQQERKILRVGYRGAAALEGADLSSFEALQKQSVRLQIKRNKTWEQLGLFCN
jgi:hypothetical protein